MHIDHNAFINLYLLFWEEICPKLEDEFSSKMFPAETKFRKIDPRLSMSGDDDVGLEADDVSGRRNVGEDSSTDIFEPMCLKGAKINELV
jgi:hypothetical protein